MRKKAKTAKRRGADGAASAAAKQKVFIGFWTSPAVKAAISTRAMLDRKSVSSMIDEVLTDWVLCRRGRK